MESEAELQRLREAVATYCRDRLSVGLPPFVLPELKDTWHWIELPAKRKSGCYAIYNERGDLLYVGLAKRALENRLWHWFGKPLPVDIGDHWRAEAAYVQMICVNEWWEAPSLECYLIHHLRPRGNLHDAYAL